MLLICGCFLVDFFAWFLWFKVLMFCVLDLFDEKVGESWDSNKNSL